MHCGSVQGVRRGTIASLSTHKGTAPPRLYPTTWPSMEKPWKRLCMVTLPMTPRRASPSLSAEMGPSGPRRTFQVRAGPSAFLVQATNLRRCGRAKHTNQRAVRYCDMCARSHALGAQGSQGHPTPCAATCHPSAKIARGARGGGNVSTDNIPTCMRASTHGGAGRPHVAVEAASTCMPCALGARHCSHARIVRHEVVDTRSEAVVKLIAVLGGNAHKLQEHQVDGAVV